MAVRYLLGARLNIDSSPEDQRRAVRTLGRLLGAPGDVDWQEIRLGHRTAERLTPGNARAERLIVYLHGGAYCVGDPQSFRNVAACLGRSCESRVLVPAYRLAPEDPFPAALDDMLEVWAEVCGQHPPESILLAGDSAGGGLALALTLELIARGQAVPAGIALFCPLTDLTLSGESLRRNRHSEPILTREWLELCANYYAADTPRDDPRLSPLFADLAGLPPLLIQAAGDDLLLDDARRFHKSACKAGVEAQLEVFADLWHVFQTLPRLLPEANRAHASVAEFLNRLMTREDAARQNPVLD